MSEKIFIGNSTLHTEGKEINGSFVDINNERFYKISNFDQMPDFFMSIVSAYDHWMFISSNGALSAGRKNKEYSLFPYYTDDKIHDSADITGSKTIIFVEKDSKQHLWEPFSQKYEHLWNIQRNLYKNVFGNRVLFEEINTDLDLIFRYEWQAGKDLGFVRRAEIKNIAAETLNVNILDGIQNVLPAFVNSDMQTRYSTLVDAYKKNELTDSGIGIYYLSSVPSDKAEPSEGLRANVVWSECEGESRKLLSSKQVNTFRKTAEIVEETDVRAERGAFFLNQILNIEPETSNVWHIIADVHKDASEIIEIEHILSDKNRLTNKILDELNSSSLKLKRIISKADGLQLTSDELSTSRHTANVLFNCMRGGIFNDDSGIDTGNFRCHVEKHNSEVFNNEQQFLQSLSDFIPYEKLLKLCLENGNSSLIRLAYEYLPLVFSRRHGDPSRPWNLFTIQLKDENGRDVFSYEGNWRDIFQNWEALAISYPIYLESMIVKFLNASTVDGYNPYRISESGIDWEVIEPDNPWSNIGYWGDHQIIYLLKLLELSVKYDKRKLFDLLDKEIFCFANVPYQIKSYEEICRNPYDTIVFDDDSHDQSIALSKTLGADAKLVRTSEGAVFQVNLIEKLLLTLFTKLSNFIPEAGIWLNTLRPEWNDANNALVGNGTSMVTLYYMRRYIQFLSSFLEEVSHENLKLTKELLQFFSELSLAFEEFKPVLERHFTDEERKRFTDKVGQAGSTYRKLVYGGYSGIKQNLKRSKLQKFLKTTNEYIDHSIQSNKRTDELYHSYNTLKFSTDSNSIKVNRLYEMLEGQVAVLSSGYLNVSESIQLLDSLKKSKLFREDQFSYLLYPNRQLQRFLQKNTISESFSVRSELIDLLDKNGDKSLVVKDLNGTFHFNGDFRNADDLIRSIEKLKSQGYEKLVEKEYDAILNSWEEMFKHSEFTGRSGTFFAYEGLGSIYWHMVSKLLLAVGEIYYHSNSVNSDKTDLYKLIEHYYEIRAGIGLNKSPDVYGAFPTDPYSHTPADEGAKQPGMTGQVKEDIISRFYELGVCVKDGIIEFKPFLLRRSEFLSKEQNFSYFSHTGEYTEMKLNPRQLAFTFCGIPIIYTLSDDQRVQIFFEDKKIEFDSLKIDKQSSSLIFKRENKILKIEVYLKPKLN